MIASLLLALRPSPDWKGVGNALDTFATQHGLSVGIRMQPGGTPGCIFDYRSGKDVYMSIDVGRGLDAKMIESSKESCERGNPGFNRQTYPSNTRLGEFCYVFDKGRLIRIGGNGVLVEARISVRESKEESQYIRLLETAARIAFAESVGAEAVVVPSESGKARPGSYRPLGPSSRSGSTKPWEDRLAFREDGRLVILALGSDQAMVDGKSTPLGGYVARRNGEWLVPNSASTDALGIVRTTMRRSLRR